VIHQVARPQQADEQLAAVTRTAPGALRNALAQGRIALGEQAHRIGEGGVSGAVAHRNGLMGEPAHGQGQLQVAAMAGRQHFGRIAETARQPQHGNQGVVIADRLQAQAHARLAHQYVMTGQFQIEIARDRTHPPPQGHAHVRRRPGPLIGLPHLAHPQ